MLCWNLEYENVGWQESACLGAAEQRRRLPEFGLTIIPSDRMGKTGKQLSARNLTIWELGPLKLFPLCSWAAVVRSREAAGVQKRELASVEAPGASAGGPQPPWCLPGCCACCLVQFRGGLSENWSPEELWFVVFFGLRLPFSMEGAMLEAGECDSPVYPAMESAKLDIYLDATLSQPKPTYLYQTPRSEQTVVL